MNPSGSGAGNNPQGSSSTLGSSRLQNPSAGSGLANSASAPAGLQLPAGVARAATDQDEPNPWETDVSRSVYAKAPDPSRGGDRSDDLQDRNQVSAKAQSDRLLLEARRAWRKMTFAAQIRCEQAKGLAIRYSPMDDSPEKIEALIRKANNLPTNPAAANSEPFRRQRTEVWMEEAEALSRWHEYDEAEHWSAKCKSSALNTVRSKRSRSSCSRIDSAKRTAGLPITDRRAVAAGVSAAADAFGGRSAVDSAVKQRTVDMAKQAHNYMARGDWAAAEQIATARRNVGTDTAFAPVKIVPRWCCWIFSVPSAAPTPARFGRRRTSRPTITVIQASPRLYNPSNDSTRNIPATETSPMRSLSTLGPATPNLLLPAPAFGTMPVAAIIPAPIAALAKRYAVTVPG